MYLTLDFETHYDSAAKYSIRSLTVIEYVRDARFRSFGASVKVDSGVSVWMNHEQLVAYFATLDWSKVWLIGHNLMFDAFVLRYHYGYTAHMYCDTMKMARYVLGQSIKGHSLGAVYTACTGKQGKTKVGALEELDGVSEPTPDQMARLGEYAKDDADEAYEIFCHLFPDFPQVEFERMSWCIDMFVNPKLRLDLGKLNEVHDHERTEKEAVLAKTGCTMKQVRSNDQFADLLTGLGLPSLPMKQSPTTGKDTYAFAKSDKEFVDLLGHSDRRIADLVAARLRVKTSIEETRAKRLADVHRRMGGWLPVPLNYCGAMPTNRLSGGEKLNLQNLGRESKLRDAIVAPDGFLICAADLSNIELRIAMVVAKQQDKIDALVRGEDLYCLFAGKLYKMTVTKADKTERMVGKVSCIAEGEQVLTKRGLVAIEDVHITDLLWDGASWVRHGGVVQQGRKRAIFYDGLWATRDHKVRVGNEWWDFGRAADEGAHIVDSGVGRRPVRYVDGGVDGASERQGQMPVRLRRRSHGEGVQPDPRQESRVRGMRQANRAGWHGQTAQADQRNGAALHKPKRQQLPTIRGSGYRVPLPVGERRSIVGARASAGVGGLSAGPHRQRRALRAGQPKTRESIRERGQQAQHHYGVVARADNAAIAVGGEPVRIHTGTAQGGVGYERRGDNPICRGRSQAQAEKLAHPEKTVAVYDILDCGPNNRFTVSGKLVHNCLSLNYQSGADTYKQMLYVMGDGMWVTDQFAKSTVQLYRNDNAALVQTWGYLQEYIKCMKRGSGVHNLTGAPLDFTADGIVLPSGFKIKYPRVDSTVITNRWGKPQEQFTYRRFSKDNPSGRDYIYGGKVLENLSQALAREVLADIQDKVQADCGLLPALQVHDELVYVIPEAWAGTFPAYMEHMMSQPLSWWPDLPLAAEAAVGPSYGDAK